MFVEAASAELRQGDACAGLKLPQFNLNSYSISQPYGSGQLSCTMPLVANGGCERFAVLSHDCDLENLKGGIIIAPILDFPFDEDSSNGETLRQSMALDSETNEFDFINFFPVHLGMSEIDSVGAGWAVIDFSLMMALSPAKKMAPKVRALKRLEMTDESRRLLAEKLASYFGRDQQPRADGTATPPASMPS